ncbi:hypothetical protein BU17DRAFT_72423 [Hysterangium stoloniferum]|nr:hypothetical protein BU17DRAFT_72423 [Hysterangium stoloniferum]
MDPAMRRDLFAEYITLQKHSKNLVFFDREFDERKSFLIQCHKAVSFIQRVLVYCTLFAKSCRVIIDEKYIIPHMIKMALSHRCLLLHITIFHLALLFIGASHPVAAALVPPGIQAPSQSRLQRATGTHALTQQHEAFKAHIADCRGYRA